MKKIILILWTALLVHMSFADTSTPCANFGAAASSCSYCFTASARPYENDGVTSSDAWFNRSTNQNQYLWIGPGQFSISILPLNGSTWNQSSSLTSMYEIPAYSGTSGGSPYVYYGPGDSSTWIRTKTGEFFRFVNHGTATSRNTALFRIAYTLQVTPQTLSGVNGDPETHTQCTFVQGRWCGDGVIDSDRGEQCDNGGNNGSTGTCSSTCQPNQALTCNNINLVPATLTAAGGNLTATCTGSSNTTQYKFIIKEGLNTLVTSAYQNSNTYTYNFPTNSGTTDKVYSVQCYVKNASTNDITSNSCLSGITIPGTPVVTPVCQSLTLDGGVNSFTNGGSVGYTCNSSGTGATYSVQLLNSSNQVVGSNSFTSATGTFNIPATPAATYTARCSVNGVTAPSACEKTITNTVSNTPTPRILITKNDADNLDDTQQVLSGDTATFTIVATNNGTEALTNVIITDALASSCNRTAGQTSPLYAGGASTNFDPGETFTYTCTKTNVVAGTFPNNINTIEIQGDMVAFPNTRVTDDDPTTITLQGTSTSCVNLDITKSGNSVSYSCTGSGNVNTYSIYVNNTQISTNSSGSINLGNGTHNFVCYINGSITSNSCQKSVTINPDTPQPQIQVIKDDNDNRDDQQQLNVGGTGQFTVTVRNPGSEPLDTVNLTDQLAPECNRSTYETINMIRATGNGDIYLNPGESFSYVCTRTNVDQSTFPNNENRVCVNGRGITSGIAVNSCDTTRVYFGNNSPICQNLQINQNGNQISATCSPNGGYRLYVLRGTEVVNTLQNAQGQFTFNLNDGNYKVACLRDGETQLQAACQRNISVSTRPTNNACDMKTSVRYGGAPLRTELTCTSQNYSACTMKINKDGAPWQTVYECSTSMVFDQRGNYEATCYLDSGENCSVNVQVDIMTIIETGPFLPIIIILALTAGGYITYRRRTTV